MDSLTSLLISDVSEITSKNKSFWVFFSALMNHVTTQNMNEINQPFCCWIGITWVLLSATCCINSVWSCKTVPQVIEHVGLSACCTTLLALAGSMYKAIAQPCDNARFTQIHDLFAGKQAAVVLVLIVMRTATSGWMFLAAQSFIHIFSMKKKSPVLRLVWRFIGPFPGMQNLTHTAKLWENYCFIWRAKLCVTLAGNFNYRVMCLHGVVSLHNFCFSNVVDIANIVHTWRRAKFSVVWTVSSGCHTKLVKWPKVCVLKKTEFFVHKMVHHRRYFRVIDRGITRCYDASVLCGLAHSLIVHAMQIPDTDWVPFLCFAVAFLSLSCLMLMQVQSLAIEIPRHVTYR